MFRISGTGAFFGLLLLFLGTIVPFASCAQDSIQNDWFFDNSKSLSELWELDDAHQKGTFVVTSYKPIYFTLAKFTTDTNKFPVSVDSDKFLAEPIDFNPVEAKFQISLKTKILHNAFWGRGDLWMAYTQRAYWQIYNERLSRPFRELNYEPELIINFPVNFKLFGFTGKMVGASIIHESNGRSDPISRSWNRLAYMLHLSVTNGR